MRAWPQLLCEGFCRHAWSQCTADYLPVHVHCNSLEAQASFNECQGASPAVEKVSSRCKGQRALSHLSYSSWIAGAQREQRMQAPAPSAHPDTLSSADCASTAGLIPGPLLWLPAPPAHNRRAIRHFAAVIERPVHHIGSGPCQLTQDADTSCGCCDRQHTARCAASAKC